MLLCFAVPAVVRPNPSLLRVPSLFPIFAFFFFVCSSNRGDASPTPASPADASTTRDDADASPKTLPIPESVSEPVAVAAAAAADAAGAVDAASVPQTADADAAPSVAAGAFTAADAAAAATSIGVDSPLPSAENEAPVDGNGDSGSKSPTGAGLGTTELVQVRLFVCGCCCGGGVPGIGGAGFAPNADDSVAPGKSIQQLYLACGKLLRTRLLSGLAGRGYLASRSSAGRAFAPTFCAESGTSSPTSDRNMCRLVLPVTCRGWSRGWVDPLCEQSATFTVLRSPTPNARRNCVYVRLSGTSRRG